MKSAAGALTGGFLLRNNRRSAAMPARCGYIARLHLQSLELGHAEVHRSV